MRDALQKLESLDAEIRLLEKTRVGAWRERIVELSERKAELEREAGKMEEIYYGR